MIMHPDRNPNEPLAAQLFQKLNEAHAVLKDEQKRALYDRTIKSTQTDPAYEAFQSAPKPVPTMTGQPTAKRGDSLRMTFDVEIDALRRAPSIKDYRYTRLDRCPACHGSGHEPATNAKPTACHACNGTSIVEKLSGAMKVRQACPDCHSGFVFLTDACQMCLGAGRLPKQRRIEVTIPAGLMPGGTLRIPKGGHAGPWGGDYGDLMLEVRVDLPDGITVKDGDLHMALPMDPISLIVGCDVQLPSGGGRLSIAPATRPGERIVLKGRGLATRKIGKSMGDLIVQIELEWPVALPSKQIKLLTEVRQNLDVANATPDSYAARKLLDHLSKRS
jgi:molecular chaperone DnaJ